MLYLLKTIASKTTTTGKPYLSVTLEESGGTVHEKVSIWSDFPNFANLAINSQVEGEVVTNDKGYKNLKAPHRPNSTSTGFGAKAMEQKSQNIEKAQQRKESAIELAATARDATILTVEWVKQQNLMNAGLGVTEEEIKAQWFKFRHWLFDAFQVEDKSVPF